MPSCPAARAPSRNRPAAPRSAERSRATRNEAGTTRLNASQRSAAGSASKLAPSSHSRSNANEGQRQLGTKRGDLEPASEATHRRLKRVRTAVAAKRDRLAVEDQLPSGERPRRFDDLGHGGGDLVALARVDGDVVARLVDLHAGAVDLPFERGFAELFERGVEVRGRLREHRLERTEELHGERSEGGGPAPGRCARHLAEVSAHHRGTPHVVAVYPERGGEGVRDESLERSLAELADRDPQQELLLFAGSASEERTESLAAA